MPISCLSPSWKVFGPLYYFWLLRSHKDKRKKRIPCDVWGDAARRLESLVASDRWAWPGFSAHIGFSHRMVGSYLRGFTCSCFVGQLHCNLCWWVRFHAQLGYKGKPPLWKGHSCSGIADWRCSKGLRKSGVLAPNAGNRVRLGNPSQSSLECTQCLTGMHPHVHTTLV